jgi:hypothetical protein
MRAGFGFDDAAALRRISMTLHRWHELECGDSNDYASWCITRGWKDKTGSHATRRFVHDDDGTPFLERHVHSENGARYEAIPDRERGALKRLAKILARYPGFRSYVQGDPRGCALYILRPGDLTDGTATGRVDPSAVYTRGIAVYK